MIYDSLNISTSAQYPLDGSQQSQQNLITFKNVLCPHLNYQVRKSPHSMDLNRTY